MKSEGRLSVTGNHQKREMKTNNTHRLAVNKVLGAALLALGLSASLSSAADLMVGFPGRLSVEEAKSSLVPITTEAAMRNEKGEPIYDCLEPHISKFGDTWYAYGFTIREKDVFAENFSQFSGLGGAKNDRVANLRGGASGQNDGRLHFSGAFNAKQLAAGRPHGHGQAVAPTATRCDPAAATARRDAGAGRSRYREGKVQAGLEIQAAVAIKKVADQNAGADGDLRHAGVLRRAIHGTAATAVARPVGVRR